MMGSRSIAGSNTSQTRKTHSNHSDALRAQEVERSSGTAMENNEANNNNNGDDQSDANVAGTNFNAYSIVPTTVPPYVLDYQFNKMKLRTRHPSTSADSNEDLSKISFKDPFLVGNGEKWERFASNIGSNVAYTKQRKRSVGSEASDEISVDLRNSGESTDVNNLEREKAKETILMDLDTEWGGGKRLQELFNTPIMGDFEFQNNEDRRQWVDYVTRLKQFYYAGVPPGVDLEKQSVQPERKNGESQFLHARNDLLGQLHNDMEKFRQLKQRKMQQWRPRLTRLLLDSQYLPLTLRMFIGMFSVIALGLAIRIYQNSHAPIEELGRNVGQQPSTIMAICVNTIAIVYIVYIAQDEFTGKPLGLRNPLGKLRLILLDLLFIIFSSANLALAFNTMFDKEWVCRHHGGPLRREGEDVTISYICRKQRALSSFLFIMVVLWVITFTISLVRVVEKVASASPIR